MEHVSDKMKGILKLQDQGVMLVIAIVSVILGIVSAGAYVYQFINQTAEEQAEVGFLIIAACCVAFGVLFLKERSSRAKKEGAMTQKTLARYGSILEQIDAEINAPSAVFLESMKLYMTENFMVSYAHGFDVIPWDEIAGVTQKWHAGSNPYLCVEDVAGEEHALNYMQHSEPDKQLFIQVLEMVQKKTA